MAIFEVHRQPLFRRHYANICSETGVYCILQGFLIIFLPLIITFSSGGSSQFWTSTLSAFSQPQVAYKYDALMEFRAIDSLNTNSVRIGSSSNRVLSSGLAAYQRQATILATGVDENGDGITDRFEINIQFPCKESEHVQGVSILLFFEIVLYQEVRYIFDSIAHIEYEGGIPLRSLRIDGDFKLRQTQILQSKGAYSPDTGNELLSSIKNSNSAQDYSISHINNMYSSRNLSMVFTPFLSLPKPEFHSQILGPSLSLFNISININIPKQSYYYSPPVSKMLKDAWIQYLSVFVVTWFLLYRLYSFAINSHLLRSHQVTDIKIENRKD